MEQHPEIWLCSDFEITSILVRTSKNYGLLKICLRIWGDNALPLVQKPPNHAIFHGFIGGPEMAENAANHPRIHQYSLSFSSFGSKTLGKGSRALILSTFWAFIHSADNFQKLWTFEKPCKSTRAFEILSSLRSKNPQTKQSFCGSQQEY